MLSRVADSLYWMSRYLERAEHTARLLDVNLQSMLDYSPDAAGKRWRRLLRCLGLPANFVTSYDPYVVAEALTFSLDTANSIAACIHIARENARQVRQQISSEMWEQLNGLYLRLGNATMERIWAGQPHAFFTEIMEGAQLFHGITDSTASHGEGWHFLQVGKYLERAAARSLLLDSIYAEEYSGAEGPFETGNYLEWVSLLKKCTAFEAYCKVYTADVRPDRIAEFLILNAEFPHSVAFCARQVRHSLRAIAATTDVPAQAKVNRLAGRFWASLDFGSMDEVMANGLHHCLRDIQERCAEIHNALYELYISYPIDKALAS